MTVFCKLAFSTESTTVPFNEEDCEKLQMLHRQQIRMVISFLMVGFFDGYGCQQKIGQRVGVGGGCFWPELLTPRTTLLSLDLCHRSRDVVHRVGGADDDRTGGAGIVERHVEFLAARVRQPVHRVGNPPAAGIERILDA